MTTTLRPIGPEQREGGTVSCAYDICVNSRPVGIIRLCAGPRESGDAGRIDRLAIEERERGRGRGAVAALAAEEVLRGWGCSSAELSIPDRAAGGLRLASALGYRERSRHMLKDLTGPDAPPLELPAGSTARPMTGDEFDAWRERDRAAYLTSLLERGVGRERAEERAAATDGTHFPRGVASAGVLLRVLLHDGAGVGTLWVDLHGAPRADADAWVFGVDVEESARGRGHGRSLMHIAEHESRAAERQVLGLNVFAGNVPALRLYESLGYRTVERHLCKPLL